MLRFLLSVSDQFNNQFILKKLITDVEMSEIECSLKCAVCKEVFSDPRVLPCGHTFCGPSEGRRCIVGQGSGEGQVTCCLCARVLPVSSVSSLPKNYSFASLCDSVVAAHAGNEVEERKGEKCPVSGHRKALSLFCNTCYKKLCDSCLKNHARHEILSLKAYKAAEARRLFHKLDLTQTRVLIEQKIKEREHLLENAETIAKSVQGDLKKLIRKREDCDKMLKEFPKYRKKLRSSANLMQDLENESEDSSVVSNFLRVATREADT